MLLQKMKIFLIITFFVVQVLSLSGCCGMDSKFDSNCPTVVLEEMESNTCTVDGNRVLVRDLMKQLDYQWKSKSFELIYVYDGEKRSNVARTELIQSITLFCESRDIEIIYELAKSACVAF